MCATSPRDMCHDDEPKPEVCECRGWTHTLGSPGKDQKTPNHKTQKKSLFWTLKCEVISILSSNLYVDVCTWESRKGQILFEGSGIFHDM